MGKTWFVIQSASGLHGGRPRRFLPLGRSTFYVLTARWEFVLTALARKGICVVERWPRGVRLGALVPAPLRWEFPSMKKKSSKSDAQGTKHLAAVETEHFRDLMALVEHCTTRQYDDGDPRETGWITIKTQGAAWVVQVKDPDACVSFSAVADTLDKALETAQLLLSCDEAPWEVDQWLSGAKAKKAKK